MIDPLPQPPALIRSLTQPIADALSLKTLPLHGHEVLLSFTAYYLMENFLAPRFSAQFFATTYTSLPPRTKINWNIRVVSTIQAIFICGLAFWTILADKERENMNLEERVWGYTGALGMTQAFAAGYFIWDVKISATNVGILGWGSLAHAVSALLITSLGFRPFANYYGVAFVLYAMSTPFLNLHWYLDKCNMTGGNAQLVNGVALLASFFGSRLVWGTYQSVMVYQDILAILQPNVGEGLGSSTRTGDSGVMRFSDGKVLPLWLAYTYLGSNTLLTVLNFYWFGRMVETVTKRFRSPHNKKAKLASE